MIEWCWRGVRFRLSLWFPAVVIAMLTADTTGLAAGCLWASVLHEAGHFAAMWAVGEHPYRLSFGAFGVRIDRRGAVTGYGKAAFISLAGPLTNGICCALFGALGAVNTAAVHGVLAVFHSLPVLGMDGGEAAYALLCCRMRESLAHGVMLCLSVCVLFPLAVLGFYLLFQTGYNFSLLLLTLYLITLLIFKEKH